MASKSKKSPSRLKEKTKTSSWVDYAWLRTAAQTNFPGLDERCSGLAQRFGFTSGFPLAARIDEVLFWFANEVAGRELALPQRKRLTHISNQAAELRDLLTSSTSEERYALLGPPVAKDTLDLLELRTALLSLSENASWAASNLGKRTRGRSAEVSIDRLLCSLRDVYTEGTGRAPHAPWTGGTSSEAGRFPKFAHEVLTLLRTSRTPLQVKTRINELGMKARTKAKLKHGLF